MELIDTHAHLYVEQFKEDLAAMVNRAKDDKVVKVEKGEKLKGRKNVTCSQIGSLASNV